MEWRQRNREARRHEADHSNQAFAGGDLERIRQAGAELLAAADEAIDRALSGDSEAFLAANRQQGGE